MEERKMERLGRNVLENKAGHKVYAMVTSEKSNKRVAVDFYVVFNDGTMSDITTIGKRKVDKSGSLDFFLDMEDFTMDDVLKIKKEVAKIVDDKNCIISIQEKRTLEEVHVEISQFIRDNAVEVAPDKENGVFIRNNYGYITSKYIDKFIKECEDLGYKRIDLLKRLKIMGALQNAKNRPYDMMISLYGEKKHYYKIELAENVNDVEEELEEIA